MNEVRSASAVARRTRAALVLVLLVLGAAVLPRPLGAVEGAGPYRGQRVIFPYYQLGPNVRTFYRVVNSSRRGGEPVRPIELRMTFFEKDAATGGCETVFGLSFWITGNDYILLDVAKVLGTLPTTKGFAVADAYPLMGQKPPHNQLATDLVVVDVAEGRAWGARGSAIRAGETVRYGQDHFATLLSRSANVQGASLEDTRLIVLPAAWQGPDSHAFNVRLFDLDERLLSVRRQLVVCFADLPARTLSNGVTEEPGAFRMGQGWLQLEGEGTTQALVLQVDGLGFSGESVGWAQYPAHDRTTAELTPDPFVSTAADVEPDAIPVHP